MYCSILFLLVFSLSGCGMLCAVVSSLTSVELVAAACDTLIEDTGLGDEVSSFSS